MLGNCQTSVKFKYRTILVFFGFFLIFEIFAKILKKSKTVRYSNEILLMLRNFCALVAKFYFSYHTVDRSTSKFCRCLVKLYQFSFFGKNAMYPFRKIIVCPNFHCYWKYNKSHPVTLVFVQNQKCYFARTHARLSGRFYFSFKFSPVICFALYVIRTKFMKSYSVSECWAAQHDILFSDSVWVNFALFIFCILLFYYFYILL